MSNLSSFKKILEDKAIFMRQIRPHSDWKYGGFEELVLDCGIELKANPLPKGIKPGTPKLCYWNCQQLIFKNKELIYAEGYALDKEISFPISHAWLMTKNKEVIDPTWRDSNSDYFGVPLATQWVKSILNSRTKNGEIKDLSIFDGNYLEGYSFLKEGLPAEALVRF